MSEIIFDSTLKAELIDFAGSDARVAQAARISTALDLSQVDTTKDAGLINYLMKKRHGSPFEHGLFTFRVEAPIFVFREWHRHRIGWSYNEQSGRYTKFEPRFYVYPEGRPLVQSGSSAHPKLTPGSPAQLAIINGAMRSGYQRAWMSYEAALEAGAANEVARAVLPVATYTSMYATCNARSLMAFLTLRVDDSGNTFETKPQWEINQLANQMEQVFKEKMPDTWLAFIKNGRVAP